MIDQEELKLKELNYCLFILLDMRNSNHSN